MDKLFTNKVIAKKIRNLKVNKRIPEDRLEYMHNEIDKSLYSARSHLHDAVIQAFAVIDVNVFEDDVEKMVEILIQRPDKCAHKLFAFADAVNAKIKK
jgi:hypothetical protein